MDALLNEKSNLRLELKKKLEGLSSERRQTASQMLTSLLPFLPPKVLSFSNTSLEINLTPLNHFLATSGRLFLPKIVGQELQIFQVNDLFNETTLHPFGFLEPLSSCKKISPSKLDLIFVPGLGFDATNHRLGYGKGFYDRFLKQISVPTWGIGFHEQLIAELPHQDHDVPLTKLFLV